LRRRRINCANVRFQQDGATAHSTNESMTNVRNHVSRAPHFPFRRRSLDPSLSRSFNVLFSFFRAYLKSRVYAHKHRTLNYLKETIGQEIPPFDRHLLARVMDDLKKKKI